MNWNCVIPDYDLISPNAMMRMHFWQRNKEHEKLVDLTTRLTSQLSVSLDTGKDKWTQTTCMVL